MGARASRDVQRFRMRRLSLDSHYCDRHGPRPQSLVLIAANQNYNVWSLLKFKATGPSTRGSRVVAAARPCWMCAVACRGCLTWNPLWVCWKSRALWLKSSAFEQSVNWIVRDNTNKKYRRRLSTSDFVIFKQIAQKSLLSAHNEDIHWPNSAILNPLGNIYKDFIDRSCPWVNFVNSTHILQCARAHDCWCWIVRVLIYIPPITLAPILSFVINSFDNSMLEDESMPVFGNWGNQFEILTVCWESARSESMFVAESIGKDADNVSTEFDAWDNKS